MVTIKKTDLMHYGTPRKSGRYPWGSGGAQDYANKRNMSWLDLVNECRQKGLTDKEIMEGMGMKSTQFRARMTIERNAAKREEIHTARKLKDKGMSNVAISEQMFGVKTKESVVRSLLAEGAAEKADALLGTATMLKDEVDRKRWVDVGSGVENHLGISKEKLNAAINILKEQGYMTHEVPVPQLGTTHDTNVKVLGPPGSEQRDAWRERDNIQQLDRFSIDGGKKWAKIHEPLIVDVGRVAVRYKEDGGDKEDGVIYLRPGVDDLSMGGNSYSQVRIKIGPDHYAKGMAIYSKDLPPGVDVLINTPKSKNDVTLTDGVLKPIKDDKDLPFGAVVRQIVKDHDTPQEQVTSAVNIVNGEGQWKEWSQTISTQVLSKQSPTLARQQLDKTFSDRQKEYDEIMSLTNPTVKKAMLESFALSTDAAAVHLDAASLKGSAWHVILPVKNMKPTEVFAPNYENGTRVALIRYPHGGPFEIPDLVVNNNHRGAIGIVGKKSQDAIGIHPDVAERLSGADFDGDTVIVIPNNAGKIRSRPPLEKLKTFNPKEIYKMPDDMPGIRDHKNPKGTTGLIMGEASNLITDMTIRGAGPDKLARAVAYSMVTIDAEKHHLDYKKAKEDFGIKALKDEFQVDPANPTKRGASTLISRATATQPVPDRKLRKMSEGGPVDPKTGRLVYVPTGKKKTLRDGTKVDKTIDVERLALTDDAHTLSTNTPIERLYADHSNRMKALANQARLDAQKTPRLQQLPSAKKAYKTEVDSLASQLHIAQLNSPRERQAQIIANAAVRAKFQANPNLDKEQKKRIKFQELELARKRTGAGKQRIVITDREWEAIQAGAISDTRLKQILANTDIDAVKKLATPKVKKLMTSAKTQRAKAMLDSGNFTQAEVAAALGVSLTTLNESLKPTGGE